MDAPSGRRTHRLLLGTLVAALLVLLGAGPASAHADLIRTTPADGSRLARAPQQVTLLFSERVNLVDNGIALLDAAGRTVPTPTPTASGDTVTWRMPASLPRGAYLVVWRVISADGHPVAGAFSFGVATGASKVAGSAAGTSDTAPWPVVTVRFAGYLAFALLLGAVAWVTWCDPRGRSDPRLQVLVRIGLVAGAAATIAGLLAQGPYATGTPWSGAFGPGLIRETLVTPFGTALFARLLLYGALSFGLWMLHWLDPVVARALVGLGLVATAVTFGGAGHGAASGSSLDLGVDTLHVLAAGTWMGGLLVLATIRGAVRREALQRFSTTALCSVLVLVVSGVLNSVQHVQGISGLWRTRYGELLLAKLAVVGLALLVAAVSRHRLRQDVSPLRTVRVEAVATVAVLAVTSVLALTSPTAKGFDLTAAGSHAAPKGPVDIEVRMPLTRGRIAVVQVNPPRTTGSLVRVRLFDARGRSLPARRVKLQISEPDRGIAAINVPVHRNRNIEAWAGQCTFPFAGTWKLALTVEDRDLTAVVASANLRVVGE